MLNTKASDLQHQILLVEDDTSHAELVSRSFEIYGQYHLILVHSLQEAINKLAEYPLDLIITDINLPDGKGTELLKQKDKNQSCPVIVMTSFGNETVAVNALKNGASDYIVKSDQTFIELPAIANRVLREWRLIQDKKIALDQQNRLIAILEATPDLICIADTDGFLTYLNKAGHSMLGLTKDENISKIRLADFHSPDDSQLIMQEGIPNAIKQGIWSHETTFISKSNEKILTSQVLISHKSESGGIEFFSTVARDIRYIRSAEEKIEYLAYYDTLTGLPNRNELLRQLENEISRVQRYRSHSALLFIDLDNFKTINDSLGHPTGDLVLKEMARRLELLIRNDDTVARLGGDEFVVILSNLSNDSLEALAQARDASKKLNNNIAKDMQIQKMTFNLTASIGIALFSAETDSAHELLRFADTAMYEAKKAGKNQFEVFHKDMGDFVHRQLDLEQKLRKAYVNNEFELYYQAKIDTTTGYHHGAEALLRWNDPDNGITSPNAFLDILESSGLIHDIGEWVLAEAIKQLAIWIAKGMWNTPHRLSINISTRQFHNADFSKNLSQLINKINVPAQCIDIEITEHSVIDDIDKAISKMNDLIKIGVSFSLDDFGTGYSSLAYLKSLPVATVKIDRSFIKDITENKSDEALVTSIIAIAKNLNLSVVAEGIETREQMLLLKQHQCEYLQGYYFSKPVSANEFTKLLSQ